MKRIISLFLLAVLMMLGACSVKTNAASLHDRRLGVDVYIGESKSDIDKDLGASTTGDMTVYSDAAISILYIEGKAATMKVSDSRWIAFSGMSVGKDAGELAKTYGITEDGFITIMYNKKSKITLDEKSAMTYMTIELSGFTVKTITISQTK